MHDVFTGPRSNHFPFEVEVNFRPWSAAEIDDGSSKGFIERSVRESKPLNASARSECFINRGTQCQSTVLGGVVIVDVEVAVTGQLQVHATVKSECCQHVIKEANAG